MSVPARGARSRRGGRGPSWPLLTALLVLAILASSTLVFTSRVELLRLAVVLSLWAAVMAAFVTVVYRRQSELDQARARDMKFVYDLQLDREISARREYELAVESHLRRQLARELRAQGADEMAALRSELSSLRARLEMMLGTDLGDRPALESDRLAVPMPAAPGRVESSRVTVVTEEIVAIGVESETVVESPIIDVPEEPLAPPEVPTPPPAAPRRRPRDYPGTRHEPTGGAPRPPIEPVVVQVGPTDHPEAPWRPPETRRGRHSNGEAGRSPRTEPAAPIQRTAPAAASPQRPEPAAPPQPPRGRHSVGSGEQPVPGGRHRGFQEPPAPVQSAPEQPAPEQSDEPQGQHVGGQSVADLMARLQIGSPGGGGRRRRED